MEQYKYSKNSIKKEMKKATASTVTNLFFYFKNLLILSSMNFRANQTIIAITVMIITTMIIGATSLNNGSKNKLIFLENAKNVLK